METINYLKLQQGTRNIILTYMKAGILVELAYAAVRGKDDEEGAVQRYLNTERIAKIRDFTLSGGAYPNAIILNWVSTDNPLTFTENTISFSSGKRLAQIIDGQHRLAGISEAININQEIAELILPVVLYQNLATKECADLFLSINTEQKPVPRSLVFDLYGITSEEFSDPAIVRARDIAIFLNEEPSSPYYGEIKMPGSKKRIGGVALSTAVSSIKPLIDEKGIFEQIGLKELESQRKVFINYFIALKKLYGNFWEDKQNVFTYSAGFSGAVDFLRNKLLSYCQIKKSFEIDTIVAVLKITEDTIIKQEEVRNLAGTEATVKVYDRLLKCFLPETEHSNYRF